MALLEFGAKGIYCPAAKVYIDPWKPVDGALITSGRPYAVPGEARGDRVDRRRARRPPEVPLRGDRGLVAPTLPGQRALRGRGRDDGDCEGQSGDG